jgi:hypothetical protein
MGIKFKALGKMEIYMDLLSFNIKLANIFKEIFTWKKSRG